MDVLDGECMLANPWSVMLNDFESAIFTFDSESSFNVLGTSGFSNLIVERISEIFSSFSTFNALSTRSWVSKLMTPNVRCSVPKGLIAFSGIPSGSSRVLVLVTASRNVVSEFWSCGRDVGVTRGRQRK